MNNRVHNPKVAGIQIASDEFEASLINGERQIVDLNDFNALYQELKGLIQEYKTLYLETREEGVRKEYDTFLAQEIDFLNLMNEIMASLEAYHDVVGFVEGREIKKEMDQAKIIIMYRNIERQIAMLRRMRSAIPDSYKEQYVSLTHQYKDLRSKVIAAEAYIIEKSSTEYNTMEVKNDTDKKKEFFTIDYNFFNSLNNLTDKINYIELIMNNIEGVKGAKTFVNYCGVTKEISTKHMGRYRQDISIITNLYKALDRSIKKLIQNENSKSNTDVCANQYASILIALYKLGCEAVPLLNHPDRVIEVTSINQKPLTILKTRQEKFQELVSKYEDLKKMTPFLDESSDLFFIQDVEKYKEAKTRKIEIFNKIAFLETKKKKNAALQQEIDELTHQLYDLYMGEKFVTLTIMKIIFKTSGLPEQMSAFYANVMGNIDGFIASEKYTDEEKRQVLSDALEKIENFIESKENRPIEFPLPLITFEDSKILKKMMVDVKQVLSALSEKSKKYLRIGRIKPSKNLNEMIFKVRDKSGYIAASLGMTVFVGLTSFVSSYEINKKIAEEPKRVPVKEENPKSEMDDYVDKIVSRVENSRKQTGIYTYNYNGIKIELDSSSPDFNDKKMALEANGAVLETKEIGG